MKITKRQLKRIIKEERAKLLREAREDQRTHPSKMLPTQNPAADGQRAARHEGVPDYAHIAIEIDRAAQIIERVLFDAEAALEMSDHRSLIHDADKLVNDAFNLAATFDTLAEG